LSSKVDLSHPASKAISKTAKENMILYFITTFFVMSDSIIQYRKELKS